jgi:hypothetical protein
VRELAPAGWENSPLLATCHPSLAQTYEEALRFHCNLSKLCRREVLYRLPSTRWNRR